MTDSVDESFVVSQNLRDSVEIPFVCTFSSQLEAEGKESTVPLASISNGSSPISPQMGSCMVRTVEASSPSTQIEALVDQSSPNGTTCRPVSPRLVSFDGFPSFELCSPVETEENDTDFGSPSTNLNTVSVPSPQSKTLEKHNSVSNSTVNSSISSMEGVENHSLAHSSSPGIIRSPSSSIQTSRDSQSNFINDGSQGMESYAHQPLSVIMPNPTVSENEKLISSPEKDRSSFSPREQETGLQEPINTTTFRPLCRNNCSGSTYDVDCWCDHCESRKKSRLSSELSSGSDALAHIEPTGVGAGLLNMGNTCFMNSVLQCFTHTVPLVQALLNCDHAKAIECNNEGFCVICALRGHIELSISSSGKTVLPSGIVNNLSYFSSFFRRYQQEDAHEFLQSFLDRLERCCLDSRENDKSLTSKDVNIVDQVFGGGLISRLRCCDCGRHSDTHEPLVGLSLEIEDVGTLQNALQSFTSVEKLDDPETKFTCDGCKRTVSKEKQLKLDRTPSVAAFHLKRFKNDGTFVEKIYKHVEFPLELDLQPYSIGGQNNDVESNYHLYAIIEHIGVSLTSGHYFCYVRSSPNTWHKLDDSQVTKVEEEFVLSQDAYILFYARNDTPWFSSVFEMKNPCCETNTPNTSPKSVLDTLDNCGPSGQKVETSDVDKSPTTHSVIRDYFPFEEDDTAVVFEGACKPKQSPSQFRDNDTPMTPVPSFDDTNYNKGSKDRTERDTDDCSPTPTRLQRSQSSRGQKEGSFSIPRDHLKLEKRGTPKRPLSKASGDEDKDLALKCLKKHMPGSRAMAFSAAMVAQNEGYLTKRKKREQSSCKKDSPRTSVR